ncbi:MAG: MSMEG_0570 family nitrogen starvation response protein [Xanthomonadaceae bacterium]|nr:MSMEG_0570 family nitrogen starvation response protein [Xanthomonadaceae bacterium]
MPAMHFELRWPDATQTRCYSPSLVIKDYFQPGTSYPLPQFMTQVREALNIASERVRAKFGFACSSAMDQLAQLEQIAQRFETVPSALVQVVAFHE